MPYPATKTKNSTVLDREILRCHNVAEVLLADDVVYGKAVDSLKYARKDERFHALMKFEEARFGTEKEPMPTVNVRYELWRLDRDKLERHMKRVIGMCDCTMKAYKHLEEVGIVSNVENREWRTYSDSIKMSELHRSEANGTQIFGYCEQCEAQWSTDNKLHFNLLERYVNKKLYIHPFINSRKDELDNVVVTERVQFDYARYRLVHGLAHCIVGNERPMVEDVERCYALEGPLAKENFDLSSYGILNDKQLTKIQYERFKNFVLFDTHDPVHQNKKRLKDIDITGVEQRRLKSWGVREDLHAFDVKYSKLRQRRGLEKLASLRFGGFTEDEVELFCIGASEEAVAKRWRETISSEIPTKLEPKIEFQNTVKLFEAKFRIARNDQDKLQSIDIYPAPEASNAEFGEEISYKWDTVCDMSEKDEEAAFVCVTKGEFPCNARDVRWIAAGMRNYFSNLDRREEDEEDFDDVTLAKYQGYETKVPIFEQEIFGNSLVAIDVNLGPPGDKREYGVVKQSALVSARVRSQYEPGFPLMPYRFIPAFGPSAKKVADAVYTFGRRWFIDSGGDSDNIPTNWDRWFALKKGFWIEKENDEGVIREGVRVLWRGTARDEKDRMVEDRKTWLSSAHVAELQNMYLKVDDTTKYTKSQHGTVPESKVIRLAALNMLVGAGNPISRAPLDIIEAKALSYANIGYNTQFWDIRSTAMQGLIEMAKALNTRNGDDAIRCVTMVCEAMDKLLLGVRAQVLDVDAIKWSLNFFEVVFRLRTELSGPLGQVLGEFLQTWRMFFSVIEKIEVPSALQDRDRKEYFKYKAKFVDLAQELDAAQFMSSTHVSTINGNEMADLIRANYIREKTGKNGTIKARLGAIDGSDVSSILKIGLLAAQVQDYTSEISFYVGMNKDKWTGLPDLELNRDKITMKMLQRSLKCLRTPLSGQFLGMLNHPLQQDGES